MTIDEAIKELKTNPGIEVFVVDPLAAKAIQLGIEALKRIKEYRNRADVRRSFLLPGETEE
jgi:hypothetical protein